MLHSSFWTPPEGDWRLSTELVALIYEQAFEPLAEGEKPEHYHYILQRRLKALGQRLGYTARLEHRTPWIDKHRAGAVDVVWDAPEGGRSLAIEIDRTWKKNSISKLLYMAATHQPVWIFLGARAVHHVPEGNELRKLHLIRLDPKRLPQWERKPRSRESQAAYYRRRAACLKARRLRRSRRLKV